MACPLPAFPRFPALKARACGTQVCLTPAEGAAIWGWARDVRRWRDLAETCLVVR